MAKKQRVLNWFEKNKDYTKNLEKILASDKTFITIRLGSKWADLLNPGDVVKISVSDNPAKPKIIGKAIVVLLKKVRLIHLSEEDLKINIGAKNIEGVFCALEDVYGTRVSTRSVISVIGLWPEIDWSNTA